MSAAVSISFIDIKKRERNLCVMRCISSERGERNVGEEWRTTGETEGGDWGREEGGKPDQ